MRTGFLEARSWACVSRVPKIAFGRTADAEALTLGLDRGLTLFKTPFGTGLGGFSTNRYRFAPPSVRNFQGHVKKAKSGNLNLFLGILLFFPLFSLQFSRKKGQNTQRKV